MAFLVKMPRRIHHFKIVELPMLRQRKSKRERREARDQALLRYQKQRQKNLLALPGVHDFILVLDHMKAGFNVAKIFRSAEAFGAREIHLIDIGPFDPSPAKGAFKKVPARFYASFDDSYRELMQRGYRPMILDYYLRCYCLKRQHLSWVMRNGGIALTQVNTPRSIVFPFRNSVRWRA